MTSRFDLDTSSGSLTALWSGMIAALKSLSNIHIVTFNCSTFTGNRPSPHQPWHPSLSDLCLSFSSRCLQGENHPKVSQETNEEKFVLFVFFAILHSHYLHVLCSFYRHSAEVSQGSDRTAWNSQTSRVVSFMKELLFVCL